VRPLGHAVVQHPDAHRVPAHRGESKGGGAVAQGWSVVLGTQRAHAARVDARACLGARPGSAFGAFGPLGARSPLRTLRALSAFCALDSTGALCAFPADFGARVVAMEHPVEALQPGLDGLKARFQALQRGACRLGGLGAVLRGEPRREDEGDGAQQWTDGAKVHWIRFRCGAARQRPSDNGLRWLRASNLMQQGCNMPACPHPSHDIAAAGSSHADDTRRGAACLRLRGAGGRSVVRRTSPS